MISPNIYINSMPLLLYFWALKAGRFVFHNPCRKAELIYWLQMKKSTCGSSPVGLILSIWLNHGSRLSKNFHWSCVGITWLFFCLNIEVVSGLGRNLTLYFLLLLSSRGSQLGTLGWQLNS